MCFQHCGDSVQGRWIIEILSLFSGLRYFHSAMNYTSHMHRLSKRMSQNTFESLSGVLCLLWQLSRREISLHQLEHDLTLAREQYKDAIEENGRLEARIQAFAINAQSEQDMLSSEVSSCDRRGKVPHPLPSPSRVCRLQ